MRLRFVVYIPRPPPRINWSPGLTLYLTPPSACGVPSVLKPSPARSSTLAGLNSGKLQENEPLTRIRRNSTNSLKRSWRPCRLIRAVGRRQPDNLRSHGSEVWKGEPLVTKTNQLHR
jgi:hypothetical protein